MVREVSFENAVAVSRLLRPLLVSVDASGRPPFQQSPVHGSLIMFSEIQLVQVAVPEPHELL